MTDRGIERLAAELRGWTGRATALPAAAARARVLARLERRPRRLTWRLAVGSAALAASALALLLVIGVLRVGRPADPVAPGPARATAAAQPVIVHQLSSGTKLYIVVPPSATADEC